MANTDKNIVITPNVGSSSADPKIVFSGADASTTAQSITLQIYPTNSGTLSFEGSTGQLFSISNTMTGTIYSVNDVSGIPSIEVLDTGIVKIAQYAGNVLLGSATDTGEAKLQVTGGGFFTGSIGTSRTTKGVYVGISPAGDPQIQLQGNGSTNPHIDFDNGTGDYDMRIVLTGDDTLNITGGALTVESNTVLHAGNYTTWAATSGHNHTYNVNDAWLRDNNDDANVKLYGNSRQMAFRTDGTTEYASGVGGYPFAWMYGGDAAGNRLMLLNTSGQLYLSNYGWLHDAFAGASHTHYSFSNPLNIDGGASNGANDATLYVTATNDNDWGVIINKFNGSSTEYGMDIRVSNAATYGFRLQGSGTTNYRISGSGTVYQNGNLYINNASPTIYLQDSNERPAVLHTNGNYFYVLRGDTTNGTSWAQFDSYWPMTLNLENNTASFGGQITKRGVNVPALWVQDTAPNAYNSGDMWWESDTGKLKIYYNDGNTTQWVDAMPIPDTSTFYSKAGGAISGPVTVSSSITATGNLYIGDYNNSFQLGPWGTGWQTVKIKNLHAASEAAIGFYDRADSWMGTLYGTNGAMGFLNSSNGWMFQVASNGNTTLYGATQINGDLTVGNTTNSNIYMTDTDETTRRIHCNSGRIGFLNSSNGWGAYCDNSGNWYANNLSGTNTGDQTSVSGSSGSCTGNLTSSTPQLAAATESNSIYVTAPTYSSDKPVKLMNFDWYGNVWSLSNIRSGSTASNGFGIFYTASGGTIAEVGRWDTSKNYLGQANITAYSDETLKTNWRDLPSDYVERLAKIKHGTYDRIDLELTQDGVSAQSFQQLLPNSVIVGEQGKLSIAYGNAALVSSIKLAQKVVELEQTIKTQEDRIARLEALVAKLVD